MPLSTTATGYHVAGLKVMTNPTRPASGACQATGSHQGSSLRRVVIVGRVPCERVARSEEHTSELQSQSNLVCRLLLEKKTIPGIDAPVYHTRLSLSGCGCHDYQFPPAPFNAAAALQRFCQQSADRNSI